MSWSDWLSALTSLGESAPADAPPAVVPPTVEVSEAARALFEAFRGENSDNGPFDEVDFDQPAARAVLAASRALKAECVVLCATDQLPEGRAPLGQVDALRQLASRLLRSKLPFDHDQLTVLCSRLYGRQRAMLNSASVLRAVERFAADHPIDGELARLLTDAIPHLEGRSVEYEREAARIRAILGLPAAEPNTPPQAAAPAADIAPAPTGPDGDVVLPLQPGLWSTDVHDAIQACPHAEQLAWASLLRHAGAAAGKARPTQRWRRDAQTHLEQMGHETFAALVTPWLDPKVAKLGIVFVPSWFSATPPPDHEVGMTEQHQDVLKGLVWFCALLDDEALAHAVATLCEYSFKKIANHGARSTRVGNACIYALGAMPGTLGIGHLTRLQGTVRYPSARRMIDTALERASDRIGVAREDLEELGVPDYGLGADGVVRQSGLAGFTAEIAVLGPTDVVLRWIKPNGKPQKTVPRAVRDAHPDTVKALKRQVKEMRGMLEGQGHRMERLYLRDRAIPVDTWVSRYLQHPLLGVLSRRLLWTVDHDDATDEVLPVGDGLHTLGGTPFDLPDDATVRLWHPLHSTLERILVWRDHLEEQGITQPFKQVWRETYQPAHPEAAEDTRFANQVIRQHPLRTLTQRHGWQYRLQGHWDSHNYPVKNLDGAWVAEFEVDPVPHTGDDHIYQFLRTGSVRIRPWGGETHWRTGVGFALGKVPPLVFSEILRTVDLFVSSCSTANDPAYDPAGVVEWRTWWDGAVWAKTLQPVAHTRRAVLERVLPRTTLRDRARVSDNLLEVDGSSQTWQIHLGSGHLRDANGTRMFLTPTRKATQAVQKVFLPFEGDGPLSAILARAFALIDDDTLATSGTPK